MNPIPLTPYQLDLIERPVQTSLFLEGPAGSGKTTVGVGRMLALLHEGIPANEILLLVPQRDSGRAVPGRAANDAPGRWRAGLNAYGGWFGPANGGSFLAANCRRSRVCSPDLPPSFLTLETALYYMAYLVRPLLEEGLFDSVTIDRNRLFSQIIDNLNKSAIIGFPYTEIGERLKSAWLEDTAQSHVYEDAQRSASLFRDYAWKIICWISRSRSKFSTSTYGLRCFAVNI